MIQLTRLRHGENFLLNPDYIERVDSHVDTVVRLTNGGEYVVVEAADEILRRIVAYRSSILAALPDHSIATADDAPATAATLGTRGALVLNGAGS